MEKQETPQSETNPSIDNSINRNTLIIVLLSFLFIISLVTAIYAIHQNNQLKEEFAQLQSQVNKKSSTSSEPTSEPNPTEKWETFNNEEFNVNIKYPKDYQLEKIPSNDQQSLQLIFNIGLENSFTFRAEKNYSNSEVKFFLDEAADGEKVIGNLVWNTYTIDQAPHSEHSIYAYQLEKNGVLYSFSFPNGQKPNSKQLEVMSSLKLDNN